VWTRYELDPLVTAPTGWVTFGAGSFRRGKDVHLGSEYNLLQ